MSRSRLRRAGLLVTSAALLAAASLATPAAAADSPEAATRALFEAATSGDTTDIGRLVCAEERENVESMFDIEGELGLEGFEELAEAISMEVTDISVEVISDDGQTATAQVTATMDMSTPEDHIEELARAVLAADGETVSEDDLEFMLPLMDTVLNTSLPIEEEVTFVVEEGEWLVCGGLVEEPEETDYVFEPVVSSEGLCGIASPAELSELGALEYDSSNGFETFCSYSNSDYEDFHSALVDYQLEEDVESLAQIYGADEQLQVNGAAAFATGPDAYADQLLVQVGDDVLSVSVTLSETPPDGVDWLTQATLVAELFAPRLADFRLELAGPAQEPTPEPTPEISLCEALSPEALSDISGVAFDGAEGDGQYCTYSTLDPEAGFSTVLTSLDEFELELIGEFFPDGQELMVGGQPAYQVDGQLWVGLDDGSRTLSVAALLFPASGEEIDTDAMAILIAEQMLPALPPLE